MSAKAEVLALVAKYGAELFDESGPGELLGSVWLPAGKVWEATSCHCVAMGFRTDRAAGWRALLADLRHGVTECRQPDCDTCEPA